MGLGYNKQAAFLALLLLLSVSLRGQTVRNYKYHFDSYTKNEDNLPGQGSISIIHRIEELNVESLNNEHGSFYRVSIPGHSSCYEPGKPELPVSTRLIIIPDGCDSEIRITDVVATEIRPNREKIEGILYPSQEGQTKEIQKQRTRFSFDKTAYSSKRTINIDTVRIERMGIVRKRQLANLIVSPVRYNPGSNKLEVIISMKIDISFSNKSDVISVPSSSESLLFSQSLDKGILNYYPEDFITGYTDEPVEMIILTDTLFRKHLEPLFRWKTQKGFRLKILYKGKDLAGETYNELKSTISKTYLESGLSGNSPEYLMIIGDTEIIPYYGTGNVSDLYYGEFDGSGDFIPEVFIGRIPVSDTTEVQSIVEKIIRYEKFEFADTNTYYSRALITTGKDETYGNYMNGQVNYAITNYLNPENNLNNYHFFYPQGYQEKDSIMTLINNGLTFINYSGHGTSSGWLHLEIKSQDIEDFNNSNMYPFVISNACRTAQFNDTASFGNKIVTASDEGAIAFIGCSNDSYWDEDFYWSVGPGTPGPDPDYASTGLGAYDRLFHTHGELPSDWFTTMGQVCFAGNLAVSSSSSPRKKYYWETYSLLGDPSMIPILGKPELFNVSLPDTLPNGIKSFSFTSEPFSYAGVSNFDSLLDASYASPSGSVVLQLPDLSDDSCLIVITGQNKIPLIKTIYFSDIINEFVTLSGSTVNDIEGNNNGKADFGETIFLKLKISNMGIADATNLSAVISSTSQWVTINQNSASIGTLPGMSEIVLENDLQITIDEYIPDLGISTIDLILRDDRTEKHFRIDISLHSPRLDIVNCILDDSEIGNHNFIADPGETFVLNFHLNNIGSSITSGQLIIESLSDDLTIIDPSVKSGLLQFGEITSIPITVKLSETSQFGDFISIKTLLDCNPYLVNKDFTFRVGRIRESFESACFRTFPWINLDIKPWIITSVNAAEGNVSARSGMISHNGSSSLMIRTVFPEDDSLKFYYKVSSELNYDYLQFRLNDAEVFRKSGEIPWEQEIIAVPAGVNKMEWIYRKDNSVSQGSDCAWLDLIDFALSTRVNYIQKDLEVFKVTSPVQKQLYGQEPVTARVLNIGKDTIRNFRLAYTINDDLPVIQHFDTTLYPFGDTITLTFDKKARIYLKGIYEISVFGYNNDDDFILNDTASISIENQFDQESIDAYPNPFSEKLNIIIHSKSYADIRITLTNSSGMKVCDLKKKLTEGENIIEINTHPLSQSFYILNIYGDRLRKTMRLIKIR